MLVSIMNIQTTTAYQTMSAQTTHIMGRDMVSYLIIQTTIVFQTTPALTTSMASTFLIQTTTAY